MNYPKRKRLRMEGFDYSRAEAYFIIICAWDHRRIFGEVVNGEMKLNAFGECVWRRWEEISAHFPEVQTDAFVVMPNHLHGILVFDEPRAGHARPLRVVGGFKAAVSKTLGRAIWQRGYYDHIIRNQRDWSECAGYIEANPGRWLSEDPFRHVLHAIDQ